MLLLNKLFKCFVMKIIRLIIVFITLLSTRPAFTQQVECLHSVKLGFPGITYSYEHALGKQVSINFETGGYLGMLNNNFYLRPVFQFEPRFYYNVKKRFDQGKFLNNSASFFSLTSSSIFDDFSFKNNTPEFFIIPKWGFRRAIGNHFIFETQIGAGLKFYRSSSQFMPGLDLKFGYVF